MWDLTVKELKKKLAGCKISGMNKDILEKIVNQNSEYSDSENRRW